MADAAERHDHHSRRCPMLGHDVTFGYCRSPDSDVPCRRIFDCWRETFDVRDFVRSVYGEAMIGRILSAPQDRAATIVDLIQKARRNAENQ